MPPILWLLPPTPTLLIYPHISSLIPKTIPIASFSETPRLKTQISILRANGTLPLPHDLD